MRVLDSLNYKGIATIPLSASLTDSQDHNIRQALKIHEAEVFILLIGVGNYPDLCQTTKSERKMAEILVYWKIVFLRIKLKWEFCCPLRTWVVIYQ